MKFDIFNESTWQPEAVSIEKAISNKALGSIGQMVYKLRLLKEKLEQNNKLEDNSDYQIAENLRITQPSAHRLMRVQVIHSGNEIADTLQAINQVLTFWSDKDAREHGWRSLLPFLQKLKPYVDDNNYSDDKYKALISTKISGNAAWDVYLAAEHKAKMYHNNLLTEWDRRAVPSVGDEDCNDIDYAQDYYDLQKEIYKILFLLEIAFAFERINMKPFILSQYLESFDNVLGSIGWDDQKLLSEIDKNWEN